jgi:uncharacterized membrane protein
MAKKRTTSGAGQTAALRFTRVNAVLGLVGLLSMTLGYWLLSQGSITAAPILLVLAYVVFLPLAIIL